MDYQRKYEKSENKNIKKISIIKYIICVIIIPTVIFIGTKLFDGKKYAFLTVVVVLLSCVPFIISFEKGKNSTEKMVILAVMIALSVFGRYCFSMIPHFKPITAITVITGIYMGGEMGFLCGALSAVLSNFIFGQGPWTPFQMLAWGMTGLIAGLLSRYLKKYMVALAAYGAVSGIIYSMIMDIWSAMWQDGIFNIKRYVACIISGIPTTAAYIVSNIIFLLILARPVGRKLERVKLKADIIEKD